MSLRRNTPLGGVLSRRSPRGALRSGLLATISSQSLSGRASHQAEANPVASRSPRCVSLRSELP
jgi:hypothetical protein